MKTLIIFLTLFIAIPSWATTYYINPDVVGGTGTGLSEANAYDSIHDPTYTCGNTYQINKGTTEVVTSVETISSQACTLGNELEITSYGTGADPIITTYTTLPNWTTAGSWSDASGSCGNDCWSITETLSQSHAIGNYWFRLWIDGTEYGPADDIASVGYRNADCSGTDAPYECCTGSETGTCDDFPWYFEDSTNTLYVYSSDGDANYNEDPFDKPSTIYSTMVWGGPIAYVYQFTNVAYLLLHDIEIQAPGIGGLRAGNLDNAKIYNMTFGGIRMEDSSNDPSENNEIYDNTIDTGVTYNAEHHPYYEGFDSVRLTCAQGNKVYHNNIGNASHNAVYISCEDTYVDGGSSNNEVYENYIYWDNTTNDYGRAFSAYGYDGSSANCGNPGSCGYSKNNLFVRNYIKNQWTRSQPGGIGNVIAYNIWDGTNTNRELAANEWSNNTRGQALKTEGLLGTNPSGMYIYNNTFYNTAECALWLEDGDSLKVINNIFIDTGVDPLTSSPGTYGSGDDFAFYIGGAVDPTNVEIDDNIIVNLTPVGSDLFHFQGSGICGDSSCTLSEFESAFAGTGAGTAANNLNTLPYTTDETTGDFTLLAKSPGIDRAQESYNAINGLCTGSGAPWSCCTGVDKGTCATCVAPTSSWPSSVATMNAYSDGLPDIGAYCFPKWGGD